MTYSIVGWNSREGAYGAAVASHVLACGAQVPLAWTGIGAAVSQARASAGAQARALEMLRDGLQVSEALAELMRSDPDAPERQMALVDHRGRVASFSGDHCIAWAGARTGPGFSVQGNVLAGPGVLGAMANRFVDSPELPLAELLVECLAAGAAAGGDRRGQQSAALVVISGGEAGGAILDLRVDDNPRPLEELQRLVHIAATHSRLPSEHALVRLESNTAELLQHALERAGLGPGMWDGMRMARGESRARALPAVGSPAPYPGGWNSDWQRALVTWMELLNLEAWVAAPGWIDQRVIEIAKQVARGESG